ncbi:MAG: tetratricopeptide repeat protein [Rhizobiales bacterium]|nr:tetratricopeptide repeat protein [Hyphomicrobiales bacterium]
MSGENRESGTAHDVALAQVREGRRALAAGDFAAAETALRKALAADPGQHVASRHLIQLLERQKRFADAIVEIDRLTALGHSDASLALRRGVSLASLDRLDEAQAAMREVFERDPGQPAAAAHYSALLERLDRADEASAVLMRALKARPDDEILWLRMGVLLVGMERGREALIALRQTLKLAPGSVPAITHLAAELTRQGQSDEAYETLREGAKAAPDAIPVLLALGAAAFEREATVAADAYRAILALQPLHKAAALRLCALLLRAGDRAGAAEALRPAAAAHPDDATLTGKLAAIEKGLRAPPKPAAAPLAAAPAEPAPAEPGAAILEAAARAAPLALSFDAELAAAAHGLGEAVDVGPDRLPERVGWDPQRRRIWEGRAVAAFDRWATLRPEQIEEALAYAAPQNVEAMVALAAPGGAVVALASGRGLALAALTMARAGAPFRILVADDPAPRRLAQAGLLPAEALFEAQAGEPAAAFAQLSRFLRETNGLVLCPPPAGEAMPWITLAAIARAPAYRCAVEAGGDAFRLALTRGPDAPVGRPLEEWRAEWLRFLAPSRAAGPDRPFALDARAGRIDLGDGAPTAEPTDLPFAAGAEARRPSPKWTFDREGTLRLALPGAAALDWPGDGGAPRLLIEPAAVNRFAQPDWGLVWRAGPEGGLASNGGYRIEAPKGAAVAVSGEGEELGLRYLELYLGAGAEAATFRLVVADGEDSAPVRAGDRLALSIFARAPQDGATARLRWACAFLSSGGDIVSQWRETSDAAVGQTLARHCAAPPPAPAGASQARLWLEIEAPAGHSVRLRLHHHQCESGAAATSPIRALGPRPYRRAADLLRLPALAGGRGELSLGFAAGAGDVALVRDGEGRLAIGRVATGEIVLVAEERTVRRIAAPAGDGGVTLRLNPEGIELEVAGQATARASLSEPVESALRIGGEGALGLTRLAWRPGRR